MAVHNHGTEQGKGLACSESLIGDCLIKVGGETIEGLREECGRLERENADVRAVCYTANNLNKAKIDALLAERDGLLATIAARHVDVIDPDTGEHYYGMILVPSMPTTETAAI